MIGHPDRKNPMVCQYCQFPGEQMIERVIAKQEGGADKEHMIVCTRCKNVKFASVKVLIEAIEP